MKREQPKPVISVHCVGNCSMEKGHHCSGPPEVAEGRRAGEGDSPMHGSDQLWHMRPLWRVGLFGIAAQSGWLLGRSYHLLDYD